MKRKILIVAAHPDDEILGCGGTVARLIKEGNEAYVLILGEGITSRDEKRNRQNREAEIRALKAQTAAACKLLGVKEVFNYDFPDNRFDTIPLLDIVKVIEKVKKTVSPDVIFTHWVEDLNIDHRVCYKAVITATRPVKEETAMEIYSFEIPSSTEWNYPRIFCPDVFFNISKTLSLKLKTAEKYGKELRGAGHPRSLNGIKVNAEYWGMRTGTGYAEAFKCVRVVR